MKIEELYSYLQENSTRLTPEDVDFGKPNIIWHVVDMGVRDMSWRTTCSLESLYDKAYFGKGNSYNDALSNAIEAAYEDGWNLKEYEDEMFLSEYEDEDTFVNNVLSDPLSDVEPGFFGYFQYFICLKVGKKK